MVDGCCWIRVRVVVLGREMSSGKKVAYIIRGLVRCRVGICRFESFEIEFREEYLLLR
jgi:hypothetical protein